MFMLTEAAGFAVLAALSPSALLIATVYLSSARPRLTVLSYLAGAVFMCVAIAIVVLVAVRSGHLESRGERTPRYGLRTGLGFLMLMVAVVLSQAQAGQARAARKRGAGGSGGTPGRKPGSADGVRRRTSGVLPVADVHRRRADRRHRQGPPLSALGLVMVVCITVACVWLPYLIYLLAPGGTTRQLAAFNGRLHAHGRTVVIVALAVTGAFLAVNGLTGLTGT